MKFPQSTLKLISQYLPDFEGDSNKNSEDNGKEYTIDELARATHLTARNIRAYQDKGLIDPPKLRGRKGIYGERHAARLKAITSLMDRGYTVNSIKELYDALEQGIGLQELMGVHTALTSPWSDEEPQTVDLEEIAKLFGDRLTPELVQASIDMGVIEIDGDQIRVNSMSVLRAGAELIGTGIPVEEVVRILTLVRGNLESIANHLVKLVSEHVLSRYEDKTLPPKEDFPYLAELIWRLKPLAEMAVKSELARAMEKSATQMLADRLEVIMSQSDQSKTE